jgi:hypothetical protein
MGDRSKFVYYAFKNGAKKARNPSEIEPQKVATEFTRAPKFFFLAGRAAFRKFFSPVKKAGSRTRKKSREWKRRE